jgi:ribosomal protein S18 acetylase RimI-like enzyme
MTHEIREFLPDDLPNVIKIHSDIYYYDCTTAVSVSLRLPNISYVYLISDVIVGSIITDIDDDAPWIWTLCVDKQHRNLGIAKKLLAIVHEKIKSIGCKKISLEVGLSNKIAIKLYDSFGYKFEKKFIGDGIIMTCDLH